MSVILEESFATENTEFTEKTSFGTAKASFGEAKKLVAAVTVTTLR